MPQSQEASDVRGGEEGRKRGRSSGTQLSSFSHLGRSDDQTSMLKGLFCRREELGSIKGAVIEGPKSMLWFCEAFHVPLRVFSCGEAEPGDPLGGAIMQCGGGAVAKRRTMSAAVARMLGGRSDGGEGQSRREGVASFIEVESGGRPVHAPSPIGRAPNPARHTSRLRLYFI